MKEKIYTIPVTEAFQHDCECAVCLLEEKLEEKYVDYFLGSSLMEPDCRIETNNKGFCKRHFEMLYNKQENRLGLGLIIDTHMCEQNKQIEKIYTDGLNGMKKDGGISAVKNITTRISSKQSKTDKLIDLLVVKLSKAEHSCVICNKLDYTMDRYSDIITHLWFSEKDFRTLFNEKKGFCLNHLKLLLTASKKYLSTKEKAIFVENLMNMQLENLQRIQGDVNWFTKKFDYRYNNHPWNNSKDAIPRSIRKIAGLCHFK